MEKKKRTISIIGIFLLVLTLVGGTLAYWTWTTNTAEQTNVVFTITSDFSCAADGGGDITSDDVSLAPTICTDTSRAIKRKVTVTPTINRNDLTISMDLWLDVKSLGSGLSASDNFKYVLTTSDSSCEEGTIIAEGNFKGLGENSKVNLLSGKRYTKTSIVPEEYYLYIWLDKNETNSNTMNQPFNLSLNGNCTDNIFFVVPEGATYIDVSGEFDNGVFCNGEGIVYNAGDIVTSKPSTCDKYTYGDYYYYYNSYGDMGSLPIVDTSQNGWGVYFINSGTKVPGKILSNINGKNVVSLSQTFMGTDVQIAPAIPSTIRNMSQTFYMCTSLTGTIEINADPTYYSDAFWETTQLITLTGTSTILDELAATSSNGNVSVDDIDISFVVPEGGIYEVRTSESWDCNDSSVIKTYLAGDTVVEEPSTCDKYTYGDYYYYYNSYSEMGIYFVDTSQNGWGVYFINSGTKVPGKILSNINGKNVVSLRKTFMGTDVQIAPIIPSTIIDMNETFSGCTSLTGIIQINADPTSYSNTFDGTTQLITLTGTSTILDELAATSTLGNVTVGN